MNHRYLVELLVQGVCIGSVEVSAESDEAAGKEVAHLIARAGEWLTAQGIYPKVPEIKPRRVLEKGEGA